MKLTEKILLDNYSHVTYGLYNVSYVNCMTFYWIYRKGTDSAGYNPHVWSREEASELEIIDVGCIIPLDTGCEEHENLRRIKYDIERMTKDEDCRCCK